MTQLPSQPTPPIPTTISPEAQRWLAQSRSKIDLPSDPTSTQAWLDYIELRNRLLGQTRYPPLAPDLPITREDVDMDGAVTYVLRPNHVRDDPESGVYLFLHGGSMILGGGELCVQMAAPSALERNMVTWAVDYRMPPMHPYPAPLDDCVAAYRRAVEYCGPDRVIVCGSSAGGNLAAALMHRAKDEELPMPAALLLLSPAVDLTETGDSFATNLHLDTLAPIMPINLLYANGADLSDPYLSPLFGDLSYFPPTFLQTGTRDLLLSNTVRFHRKLRSAGVEAELHVWEAMTHRGFSGESPEDIEMDTEISRFVEQHRTR